MSLKQAVDINEIRKMELLGGITAVAIENSSPKTVAVVKFYKSRRRFLDKIHCHLWVCNSWKIDETHSVGESVVSKTDAACEAFHKIGIDIKCGEHSLPKNAFIEGCLKMGFKFIFTTEIFP